MRQSRLLILRPFPVDLLASHLGWRVSVLLSFPSPTVFLPLVSPVSGKPPFFSLLLVFLSFSSFSSWSPLVPPRESDHLTPVDNGHRPRSIGLSSQTVSTHGTCNPYVSSTPECRLTFGVQPPQDSRDSAWKISLKEGTVLGTWLYLRVTHQLTERLSSFLSEL